VARIALVPCSLRCRGNHHERGATDARAVVCASVAGAVLAGCSTTGSTAAGSTGARQPRSKAGTGTTTTGATSAPGLDLRPRPSRVRPDILNSAITRRPKTGAFDDLAWADVVLFGTSTRFGNPPATSAYSWRARARCGSRARSPARCSASNTAHGEPTMAISALATTVRSRGLGRALAVGAATALEWRYSAFALCGSRPCADRRLRRVGPRR
jgi:hypothetical protein